MFPLGESEQEIAEALSKMNFKERFKGLPSVKILFDTSNGTRRALEEKQIRIGYRVANCEPFDKYQSRPQSHFIQCSKCFGLNHFPRDCVRKEACTFYGRRNHTSTDCYYKNKPNNHRYILCRGQHTT